MEWLIETFNESKDKENFFNSFMPKLAGTKKMQQQIEQGLSSEEIKKTWQADIENFKKIRLKYLIYN